MYKVLIVDDNDNNRLTLNLLLEEVEDIEVFRSHFYGHYDAKS